MTATDLDLDALLDALTARALERAQAVELVNVAGQPVGPGLRASTGRLNVNPGDIIASVWGNTTYDQTMQVFDTVAARDSQWPTPKDGAVCYTLDAVGPWLRRNGAWKGLPLGVLAQAIATANSSSTTTSVTWFSAPAVTMDGTRRIKVSYTGFLNAGTANDLIGIRLLDGASTLQGAQSRVSTAGGTGQASVSSVWQGVPAAGAHTYSLQVLLLAGTGPAIGAASSANPATLLVEDIGT